MESQHQAANERAEKCVAIVGFIVYRLILPNVSAERLSEIGGIDELLSTGFIELVNASRVYDPTRLSPRTNRPVKFSTFAMGVLRQKLWRLVINRRPAQRLRSGDLLEETLSTDGDVADLADHDEQLQRIASAVERLPDRLRHVVEMRFYSGLTLREIAERMEISWERVRQIEAAGLRDLAAMLGAPVPRAWAKIAIGHARSEQRRQMKEQQPLDGFVQS